MTAKINGNFMINDNGTDLITLKELNTQVMNNTDKLNDYIKLYVREDNTAFSINAGESVWKNPAPPVIEGYKFLACIDGQPIGNTNLIAHANGWIFNPTTKQQSFSGLKWTHLFIKI